MGMGMGMGVGEMTTHQRKTNGRRAGYRMELGAAVGMALRNEMRFSKCHPNLLLV